MCGIAGFHLKKEGVVARHDHMERFADKLLTGVEFRGRQATGYAAISFKKGNIAVEKKPLIASEFVALRKRLPKDTRTFVGHTRWATQGSNEVHGNLHPVSVGGCFVTHNGSIWNDEDLFKEHELTRSAEVDTEIIPALIHKYGWEALPSALKELRGSYAIAAFDYKHPGQLVLAKGDFSPLCFYETDNFIVWASTKSAIRDAWKEVLGTPPDYKKINELQEGELLFIDGSTVDKRKFELAEPPFRRADDPKRLAKEAERERKRLAKAGQHGGMRPIFENGRRNSHGRNDTERGFHRTSSTSGSRSTRGVVVDRREAVKTLRADGNGKAILHGDKTMDELTKICKGRVTFYGCPGCGALVLHESMEHLEGEGSVCVDCVYISRWGTTDALVVDEATVNHFNKWARKEVRAHTRALFEVSKLTKLDVPAVDYLVYRVSEVYLEKTPGMRDLVDKLDDLYQEAYAAAFDGVLDEIIPDRCEWDSSAKTYNIAPACDGRCTRPACKKKFELVRGSEDETRTHPLITAKQVIDTDKTLITVDKCWCGEEATIIVGGLAGFCAYHYRLCNEERCEWGLSEIQKQRGIRAKANHLLTSGKRVCHFHARSQKGAMTDAALAAKGVHIIERQTREPAGL